MNAAWCTPCALLVAIVAGFAVGSSTVKRTDVNCCAGAGAWCSSCTEGQRIASGHHPQQHQQQGHPGAQAQSIPGGHPGHSRRGTRRRGCSSSTEAQQLHRWQRYHGHQGACSAQHRECDHCSEGGWMLRRPCACNITHMNTCAGVIVQPVCDVYLDPAEQHHHFCTGP